MVSHRCQRGRHPEPAATYPHCGLSAILHATVRTTTLFVEEPIVREHLVVSGRGQVTLPASIRKKYGIGPGDVVILDDQSGQLTLRPAAVIEVETYSDGQIREWNEADRLTTAERDRILAKLGRNA